MPIDPLTMGLGGSNPGNPVLGSGGGVRSGIVTPGSTQTSNQGQNFLESVLPGIGSMTSSATGVIQNLLNGLPSASQAKTNNAYFGVGAGQPDTGGVGTFTGNRGADLYGQQAGANRQQGLQDLFSSIGAYSSPILQNQGQQLQNNQFGASLNQQGNQFNQNYQLQKFQAMLGALGLGNNIVGQPQQNIPLTL